jgi:hypothetical protein
VLDRFSQIGPLRPNSCVRSTHLKRCADMWAPLVGHARARFSLWSRTLTIGPRSSGTYAGENSRALCHWWMGSACQVVRPSRAAMPLQRSRAWPGESGWALRELEDKSSGVSAIFSSSVPSLACELKQASHREKQKLRERRVATGDLCPHWRTIFGASAQSFIVVHGTLGWRRWARGVAGAGWIAPWRRRTAMDLRISVGRSQHYVIHGMDYFPVLVLISVACSTDPLRE